MSKKPSSIGELAVTETKKPVFITDLTSLRVPQNFACGIVFAVTEELLKLSTDWGVVFRGDLVLWEGIVVGPYAKIL